MSSSFLGKRFFLVTILCCGVSSCATFKSAFSIDQPAEGGLVEVDDLLGHVEHLYIECEISGRDAQVAFDQLSVLVDSEFQGDIVLAYADFLEAVERSEVQAEILREGIKPMERAAEQVFAGWEEDLEEFTSESMRNRSQGRLNLTRARYQAVADSVIPTSTAIDRLNQGLRDHALYLAHDLNAESVALIEDEVESLTQLTQGLSIGVRKCLAASEEYVRATALRGQLETAVEPEPEAPSPGRVDEP